jgi:hypothetical protein
MAHEPSFHYQLVFYALDDVDFSAEELDSAWAGGEKGIVPAHIDVLAGEEFGAALANDYTAGLYDLSGIQLNASVFGITVSAVSC